MEALSFGAHCFYYMRRLDLYLAYTDCLILLSFGLSLLVYQYGVSYLLVSYLLM